MSSLYLIKNMFSQFLCLFFYLAHSHPVAMLSPHYCIHVTGRCVLACCICVCPLRASTIHCVFCLQHIFIPVLPNKLIDFCCSPLPYILGILPQNLPLLEDMDMEEVRVCYLYCTILYCSVLTIYRHI